MLSGFVNPNAQHPEVVVIFVEQEAQPAREAYAFLQVPSNYLLENRYESFALIFNFNSSTDLPRFCLIVAGCPLCLPQRVC